MQCNTHTLVLFSNQSQTFSSLLFSPSLLTLFWKRQFDTLVPLFSRRHSTALDIHNRLSRNALVTSRKLETETMVAINALALFAALSSVVVAAPHNTRSRSHTGVAARHELPVARGYPVGAQAKRGCRPRPVAVNAVASAAPSDPAPPPPAQQEPEHNEQQHQEGDAHNNGGDSNTSNNNPAPENPPVETSHAFAQAGLISVQDWRCGGPQASADEPNGKEGWLNCGVEGEGWNPPNVGPWDLKSVGLDHPHFAACSEYFELFTRHGNNNGLPPVLLASIALQESSCVHYTEGKAGGENGLMQISGDKCEGRDAAACREPEFNVATGAKYLKNRIDNAGGNVLQALGQYNGWPLGMTVTSAKAADGRGACHQQNNLDYLYQIVNGHMQGKEAWNIGSYQNLAHC